MNLNTNSLISVVMPTYNQARFLSYSIDSVLNQTFENWELIIVDDASTDNTKKIVEQYQKNNSKITYLLNEKNIGIANSRNIGINNSHGKYQ